MQLRLVRSYYMTLQSNLYLLNLLTFEKNMEINTSNFSIFCALQHKDIRATTNMIYTTSEDISLSIQTKVITQENLLYCSLTKIQEKVLSVVWEINTLLLNYKCNNFSIQTFTSQ